MPILEQAAAKLGETVYQTPIARIVVDPVSRGIAICHRGDADNQLPSQSGAPSCQVFGQVEAPRAIGDDLGFPLDADPPEKLTRLMISEGHVISHGQRAS